MNHTDINPARLRIWKFMEFSGILPNKKRKMLVNELEKLGASGLLDTYEKMIIRADNQYPQNRRERMKFLKQELKVWEKIAPC